MVAPREIFIPQAMQRHTGCAWVHPARAEEKPEKPKPEAAADSRDLGTRQK
jgi:hypothetical protein